MRSAMEIELLTTAGCHLCEQAEKMLLQVCPDAVVRRVDIAESDGMIEEYGERIPVLRYGGREISWPFSLLDLRNLIVG